jgi:hypothetical protein
VATDATELVVALVTALVMALAKLAAIRRPESLLATFIKVASEPTARWTCARPSLLRHAGIQGAGKAPNPSMIDGIYG